MDNLCATGYPAGKLSLAFLESDSRDATASCVEQLLARHASRFARTRLLRRDFGFHPGGLRWEPQIQRRRRAILAQCRNLVLEDALDGEDWVLWIDVDVVSWPPDIIHRLIGAGRPIVTPHCVQAPGGPSFDLNTFVFRDPLTRDGAEHLADGIYQPPRGATRRYLDSFRDRDEVEVDGVGGTMLMVDGGLHRDGLRFPARPYRGFLETEGLAMMARDFGVACWGLPKLEIIHH
jgi:Anp1